MACWRPLPGLQWFNFANPALLRLDEDHFLSILTEELVFCGKCFEKC